MYTLVMKTEERRRLNGIVLSVDTEEKFFDTVDDIKKFIISHEYLKRVKGIEGKVFTDLKDGGSREIGFILKGRYKDWEYSWGKKVNFTHYETVWCEVFKKERILI